MNLFDLSTKNKYNLYQKVLSAQTHLQGAFMPHAKRYQKSQNFLRRNPPYSLWWNVSNSVVLQKTQNKMDFAEVYQIPSEKQPLLNRGTTFSFTSYHNCWPWAPKFHQNTSIQWFISSNSWTKTFPQCNYPATFSSTTYSSSTAIAPFSSRPPSPEDILLSQATYQRSLRFRLNYPYCDMANWRKPPKAIIHTSLDAYHIDLSSASKLTPRTAYTRSFDLEENQQD